MTSISILAIQPNDQALCMRTQNLSLKTCTKPLGFSPHVERQTPGVRQKPWAITFKLR